MRPDVEVLCIFCAQVFKRPHYSRRKTCNTCRPHVRSRGDLEMTEEEVDRYLSEASKREWRMFPAWEERW